jgi:hypothetical protein
MLIRNRLSGFLDNYNFLKFFLEGLEVVVLTLA